VTRHAYDGSHAPTHEIVTPIERGCPALANFLNPPAVPVHIVLHFYSGGGTELWSRVDPAHKEPERKRHDWFGAGLDRKDDAKLESVCRIDASPDCIASVGVRRRVSAFHDGAKVTVALWVDA
jgi:hypothetical protein